MSKKIINCKNKSILDIRYNYIYPFKHKLLGEGSIQTYNKTNTSDFEKFLLNGDIEKFLSKMKKLQNLS